MIFGGGGGLREPEGKQHLSGSPKKETPTLSLADLRTAALITIHRRPSVANRKPLGRLRVHVPEFGKCPDSVEREADQWTLRSIRVTEHVK